MFKEIEKQIICWIVIFFISFVAEKFDICEQGIAFFGLNVIIFLLGSIEYVYFNLKNIETKLTLKTLLSFFILTFMALVTSRIFKINFYIAFEILTLGNCIAE